MNEQELIREAVKGSHSDFESLMSNYMKDLYNYILIRLKSKDDAMDVMQEVMLGVYQSIKYFNGDSSFKTWLFSITRRKIADYYREQYKNETEPIDNYLNSLSYNNEFDLLSKISIQAVIDSLPLDEKELLYLIFTQQLSHKEIEEITNIPIGTIKSKMYYIKAKLKLLLNDDRRN